MQITLNKPFPGYTTAQPEGADLWLASPTLVLIWGNPRPDEIRAVQSETALFSVCRLSTDLLFLCYRFGDMPWSDQPYHRALEVRARGVFSLPEFWPGQLLLLTVVLVEAESTIVRALRQLTLGPEASQVLLETAAEQAELPANYDEQIQQTYQVLTLSGGHKAPAFRHGDISPLPRMEPFFALANSVKTR